jgi:hypothetical protein
MSRVNHFEEMFSVRLIRLGNLPVSLMRLIFRACRDGCELASLRQCNHLFRHARKGAQMDVGKAVEPGP